MSSNYPEALLPTALPFGADQLATALEAGSRWWTTAEEPLMQANCEAISIAIKACLEQRDMPVDLMMSQEPPRGEFPRMLHVFGVVDLAGGRHVIDGNHGQFLSQTVGYNLRQVEALKAGQFKRSGARCVVFPSIDYETAIQATMQRIFGDEADDALMERAQAIYGEWWKPSNFRPYKPNLAAQKIADLILPPMRGALGLNWHS